MDIDYLEITTDYINQLPNEYIKKHGVFYTDLELANKIIEFLPIEKENSILDPCCGMGSFLISAVKKGYSNVIGIDQDNNAITLCKKRIGIEKLYCYDSLTTSGSDILKKIDTPEKVDVIIGNPPYVPINKENPFKIQDNVFLQKVRTSGNNLFIVALYRALELVKEEGIISYIIPKNFLHIESYQNIRKFLLTNKTILSIIDIGAYFKSVRGEQIILTIKNQKPKKNHSINFYHLSKQEFIPFTHIRQSFYADKIQIFNSQKELNLYQKLSSFYTINDTWEGNICRGRLNHKDAISGKDIQKFGLKEKETPTEGSSIFLQNIYSSEAGIIASLGGNYNASQTVTVITGNEIHCYYLLGLLHSLLYNYFLYKFCYNQSKLTLHTDAKYIKQLPIIPYGNEKTKMIELRVKELLTKNYLSKEWFFIMDKINDITFSLFHITKEERNLILEEMKKIQSKKWFTNLKNEGE